MEIETKELVAEIQRRYEDKAVVTPYKAMEMFTKNDREKEVECFWAVLLDASHKPMKKILITKGLLDKALIHPREVFRPAIKNNAAAIIIAHNHPSGRINPSSQDREVTTRMIRAGELIGIPVLDHLIISAVGYYSFEEEREMRS